MPHVETKGSTDAHAAFDTAVTVSKTHSGLDLTGKECSGVLYILPEKLSTRERVCV